MAKADFINRVLQVLNEADATATESGLLGADLTNIEQYVENLFSSAWRRAVNIFPRTWFSTKSFAIPDNLIVDAPQGTGYVFLPDDFLLLSSFKMKGWKSSCLEAPEETREINRKQSNDYTRGTPQRPVCVLRLIYKDDTPQTALFYYSLPKSESSVAHIIEHALYIPVVRELTDTTKIDQKLFDPLAYLCASTVLTSLEKGEAAKQIDSKILQMI